MAIEQDMNPDRKSAFDINAIVSVSNSQRINPTGCIASVLIDRYLNPSLMNLLSR